MEKSYRTIQEYTEAVRKYFPIGGKTKEDVDAYFEMQETKDYIKDAFYNQNMAEATPQAVASCLDMMY